MRIFVSNAMRGKPFPLDVHPHMTISQVTEAIENLKTISVLSLQYQGKLLDNSMSVGDADLTDNCTINLSINYTGGGPNPIKFNSLKTEVFGVFSKKAPAWRVIDKGFNLEGVCGNVDCDAHNRRVWVQFNFGKFNLSRLVYTS